MIKVIIVEDQLEVLQLMAEIIQLDSELDLIGKFSNGESAAKEIPSLKADVVMMDIGLPGISGIDCIKLLKSQNVGCNFMVCSSFGDEENVYNALEAGATSYILKSAQPKKIIEAIKELANGGSPMSPQVARHVLNKFFKKDDTQNPYVEVLTNREFEVLSQLSKGLLYKEISDNMQISINTLKVHCYNIYQKLHVNNKIEAINKVFNT